MEAGYKARHRTVGYFKSKQEANQLRTILREEGFERLFWRHPNSEIYSKGEIKAKITASNLKQDDGCPEHGIAPYEYRVVGIEFNKFKVYLNKTLTKKIDDWYFPKNPPIL